MRIVQVAPTPSVISGGFADS
ncbi:MAG: hypothetical protein YK1309IOTA_210004, partial [Marine Group I thaumarchaeote]